MCVSLFCYALLCVHFSFAIILKRKRKLVALLLLPYRWFVTINALLLFLTVPWVGQQYVIVVFPDHTNLFWHPCTLVNACVINVLESIISKLHTGVILIF